MVCLPEEAEEEGHLKKAAADYAKDEEVMNDLVEAKKTSEQ